MKIDEKLIKKAVSRILNVVKPERIILFGSAATGEITPDSDLDLLVIERFITNQREESIRLRSALGDFEVPIDVFTMTPERFDETKDVIGGLAYPDSTEVYHIFVADAATGEIAIVSTNLSGGLSDHGKPYRPRISEDGRIISFTSDQTDLVEGDINGLRDVFQVTNPIFNE